MYAYENKMIATKPSNDLDPAMKSALKNHIMRKRQQLKQELEQDAIEKRLKREQEAKRKQDAMTLDQLKEQLSQLEKTLDNLKNEKHCLFAKLKQNMRVLNEDDTRRKHKEEEINAQRQQQHQQNQQQQQQMQQQQQQQQQQQIQHQQQQQQQQQQLQLKQHQQQQQQIQQHHHQQQQIQQQQLQQQQLQQQQLQQHQLQQQLIHDRIQSMTTQSMSSTPPMSITAQPMAHQASAHPQLPMMNGTIPAMSLPNLETNRRSTTPRDHHKQQTPSSEPNMNQHVQRNQPQAHQQSLSQQIQQQQPPPIQQSAPHQPSQAELEAAHAIASQAAHLQRPNSLFNSAAFSHLLNAHNLRGQSPYLNNPQQNRAANPYGPMSPFSSMGGPHQPSLISGHGIPTSMAHMPQPNPMLRMSPPPMSNNSPMNQAGGSNKLPLNMPLSGGPGHIDFSQGISAAAVHQLEQQQQQQQALHNQAAATAAALGIQYEPPRKKMHSSPSQQSAPSNSTNQMSAAALNNPYLSYANFQPGLGGNSGPGAGQMPANLFAGQNLMRTPPPPNLSSFLSSAAISQLINAHNLRGQSPYLSHLQQPNRNPNPYASLNPYSHLAGGHQQPSLISGHGIPTSLAHMSQSNPMIRPSPPPMSNSPMNSMNGPPKSSMNLPMNSSQNHMDISARISAQQMQQQQAVALSNQAAATAAALGIPFDQPRKKIHSSQGPPQTPTSIPTQMANSMANPYLSYPGLPPGFMGAGGPGGGLPANLFAGQNLMRTPPPANISSLLNSAAFSHLLNAQNFREHNQE